MLTGGCPHPAAHVLILAVTHHKSKKESAFHKHLTFTSLRLPQRALLQQCLGNTLDRTWVSVWPPGARVNSKENS